MTRDSSLSIKHSKTTADSAVDGLLAGLAGGAAMAVYLVMAALLDGASITALLASFDLSGAGSPLTGLLLHLAVAGAYGALFGVLTRLLPARFNAPCYMLGLTYGLVLLLLSLVLPQGLPGFPQPMQALQPMQMLIAHVLYGVVVGLVIGWARR